MTATTTDENAWREQPRWQALEVQTKMLTPNFSRSEFACNGIACCAHSAPITLQLVHGLEDVRALLNALPQYAHNAKGVPMNVNSGFRCIRHNRNVGSRDTSQHTLGNAADIALPAGITIDEFAALFEQVECFAKGGIGKYNTFIHADVRNCTARWDYR